MFGLGPLEICVIGAIAVMLYGKNLPEVGRSFGKTIGEMKKRLIRYREISMSRLRCRARRSVCVILSNRRLQACDLIRRLYQRISNQLRLKSLTWHEIVHHLSHAPTNSSKWNWKIEYRSFSRCSGKPLKLTPSGLRFFRITQSPSLKKVLHSYAVIGGFFWAASSVG